jgi:hypothetical protein
VRQTEKVALWSGSVGAAAVLWGMFASHDGVAFAGGVAIAVAVGAVGMLVWRRGGLTVDELIDVHEGVEDEPRTSSHNEDVATLGDRGGERAKH